MPWHILYLVMRRGTSDLEELHDCLDDVTADSSDSDCFEDAADFAGEWIMPLLATPADRV